MDPKLFQERIISLIKSSLRAQGLSKRLRPQKLIDHRDRYFLVQCANGTSNKKAVFLRHDKWFWFLHGVKSIPEMGKKRKYDYKVRKPAKQPTTEEELERAERIAEEKRQKEEKGILEADQKIMEHDRAKKERIQAERRVRKFKVQRGRE